MRRHAARRRLHILSMRCGERSSVGYIDRAGKHALSSDGSGGEIAVTGGGATRSGGDLDSCSTQNLFLQVRRPFWSAKGPKTAENAPTKRGSTSQNGVAGVAST